MKENERWNTGKKRANYYEQALKEAVKKAPKVKVIHPKEMPWEETSQGTLKHMINERMEDVQTLLDLYIQELMPGGKSGKHHHMAEECLYILEGKGYDLHWDMDLELKDKYCFTPQAEPKRFEWEEGDLVLIPVNTVHQHFNAAPDKPARFISATSCLYRRLAMNNLTQMEAVAAPRVAKNRTIKRRTRRTRR